MVGLVCPDATPSPLLNCCNLIYYLCALSTAGVYLCHSTTKDASSDFSIDMLNGATWACRDEKNVMYNDRTSLVTFTPGTQDERKESKKLDKRNDVHHPNTLQVKN